MLGIPWNPLRAVLLSSLRSILPLPKPSSKIPVFIMLPLDTATPSPLIPLPKLKTHFQRLKKLGLEGVMLDVWWGLCEQSPGHYDFSQYVKILQIVKEVGLKLQAVMSFHSCGGNVGDNVNIPLPEWVVNAADQARAWFRDRHGCASHEYLSFGADHLEYLPALTGIRTPVAAYTAFVKAFVEAVDAAGLKDVLVELQVGLGPCGELRYPSYPLAEGKWRFPGIGEFQCYDKYLLESLAIAEREGGVDTKSVTIPPDTGEYNDKAWDTRFFRKDRKTKRGKRFLDWYSGELLRHGDDVLSSIKSVTDIQLAVKVAGIHWWYHHSTRAAETTTGYVNSHGSIYPAIASLCARYEAILDFTCLEMRSVDQPLRARCGPRQLVTEVFKAASDVGVSVSGENALERWDWGAYRQVLKAFRRTRVRGVGFTLLRLKDDVSEEGWENLGRLVRELQVLSGTA